MPLPRRLRELHHGQVCLAHHTVPVGRRVALGSGARAAIVTSLAVAMAAGLGGLLDGRWRPVSVLGLI